MFDFLKKERITYTVYSKDKNLSEKSLKVIYDILKKNFYKKYSKKVNFREFTEFKFNLLSFVTSKNNYIFTINRNKKIIGFSIGVVKNNNFYESHTYIYPRYHNKGFGTKLRIRALSYTRNKFKIKKFISLNVENNAIFDINKRIANRKNFSKVVNYTLKKDNSHNIFNKKANYIHVRK